MKSFIIIASFAGTELPPEQFTYWRTGSLQSCEELISDTLYGLKIDFDMEYVSSLDRRIFVTEGIGIYDFRKTRLSCLELRQPE